jgi:hypothetical protein
MADSSTKCDAPACRVTSSTFLVACGASSACGAPCGRRGVRRASNPRRAASSQAPAAWLHAAQQAAAHCPAARVPAVLNHAHLVVDGPAVLLAARAASQAGHHHVVAPAAPGKRCCPNGRRARNVAKHDGGARELLRRVRACVCACVHVCVCVCVHMCVHVCVFGGAARAAAVASLRGRGDSSWRSPSMMAALRAMTRITHRE